MRQEGAPLPRLSSKGMTRAEEPKEGAPLLVFGNRSLAPAEEHPRVVRLSLQVGLTLCCDVVRY